MKFLKVLSVAMLLLLSIPQVAGAQADVLQAELDGKMYSIPVEKIPGLKQYLAGFVSDNMRQFQLDQARVELISKSNHVLTLSVAYGCGVKDCEHTVLVQIKDVPTGGVSYKSLPVSQEDSLLQMAEVSHRGDKLFLVFGREGTKGQQESKLIAVNLNDLTVLQPLKSQDRQYETFGLPIWDAKWTSDDELSVWIPDTEKPVFNEDDNNAVHDKEVHIQF